MVAVLDDTSVCANCGKESKSDDMNTCKRCKEVKYCNAACKKKHRSKHKKKCEKRVAELHEEQLFKEIEPEECPICMLPLKYEINQSIYKSCCGKTICDGCVYAMKMSEGKDLCPFCRTPKASSAEEHIKQTKKLMDRGNAYAFTMLGGCYAQGTMGMPQDHQKACELFLKSGELGSAEAYYHLGNAYDFGRGVGVNKMKARHLRACGYEGEYRCEE